MPLAKEGVMQQGYQPEAEIVKVAEGGIAGMVGARSPAQWLRELRVLATGAEADVRRRPSPAHRLSGASSGGSGRPSGPLHGAPSLRPDASRFTGGRSYRVVFTSVFCVPIMAPPTIFGWNTCRRIARTSPIESAR